MSRGDIFQKDMTIIAHVTWWHFPKRYDDYCSCHMVTFSKKIWRLLLMSRGDIFQKDMTIIAHVTWWHFPKRYDDYCSCHVVTFSKKIWRLLLMSHGDIFQKDMTIIAHVTWWHFSLWLLSFQCLVLILETSSENDGYELYGAIKIRHENAFRAL